MEKLKTNRDLYNLLKHDLRDHSIAVEKVMAVFPNTISSEIKSAINGKIRKFLYTVKNKRKDKCWKEDLFLSTCGSWLDLQIDWSHVINTKPPTLLPSTSTSSKAYFNTLSDRQKRRRTESVRSLPIDELNYVASKSIRHTHAKFIFDFIQTHPAHITKVKEFCEKLLNNTDESKSLSDDDALSLYVNSDLTREQYSQLRLSVNNIAPGLFPAYAQIQKLKKELCPVPEAITVAENYVSINLQCLLDKTIERIMRPLKFDNTKEYNLVLVLKWGCDGASSQSVYKQKSSDPLHDDSSVFVCSLVPLQLNNEDLSESIWKNPTPSSSRYCRPISFRFEKENKNLTKKTTAELNEEIRQLRPYVFKNVVVNYKMLLTMVDTKICNDITDTSSAMKCFICGATPKAMNDIDVAYNREPNQDCFEFGMSSLHAWIRSFECMLHIAYNLSFKSWSARGENKNVREQSKRNIQDEFKRRLGLLIDMVKQGVGNTNDGNTARRFFANFQISADITGLNVDLLKRFYIILQVIASGLAINVDSFRFYTRETAELYVQLYGWYYMPVTIHKILIHGADIIKHNAILPIGALSEDAQECNHKIFRYVRLHHTRKISRIACNTDLIHALLLRSGGLL